ncbi:MAG: sulfite exporter TauE/SafE family protein [Bauldia sp.]|nr:sulfite exporter TauE/SafE family protein [Bauldia sp.]MCW5718372.1 sulfite exporter TauE/SafE family protein [Bauldia sp.]
MDLTLAQDAAGLLAGGLVGFSLALTGGGGSILAVPLLVYLVGVADPHTAIGTSAVAVAGNAAVNLVTHARAGNVKWRCASVFTAAGVAGALLGSTIGKAIDGERLLALFAILMVVVAGLMLWRKEGVPRLNVRLDRDNFPWLVTLGIAAGTLSGFFGIGGGFLVVPALMLATGMPVLNAIGSSLVAVTAFGLTTAANYATSGLVDWVLAAVFVAGGIVGGIGGALLARRLAARRGLLRRLFAVLILAVAVYMFVASLG